MLLQSFCAASVAQELVREFRSDVKFNPFKSKHALCNSGFAC